MTFIRSAIAFVIGAAIVFADTAPSKNEIDSFRLSMPKIQATLSAYTSLVEAVASDPALAARFKAEEKKLEDTNGRDTMSLTAQRLQAAEPRVAAAFTKAGISAKEAGMTMECLVGVMLGAGMLEATKTEAAGLPAYVRENIAFYRQNKDAIMTAFKQLQSVGARLAKEDEEEEGEEQ
jgi:hypothetical protein